MRINKVFRVLRIRIWVMFVVLSLLIVSFVSYAVQEDQSDKAFMDPANIFYNLKEEKREQIEDNRDQYLKERGWKLSQSAVNPGGAYIGWGRGDIKLEPDDAKYGQARILAFYRALANAKGDFVKSRQSQIITTMTREFYLNEQPEIEREMNNKTYLQERISILAEKAIDLGEGYLNRLLSELNIDPNKYRVAEKSERESITRDSINQKVTVEAISSLVGVQVLHNFYDLKSVGVLIIYNEESERIAKQIARGDVVSRRPSDMVAKTIQDQLEAYFKSDEDYIKIQGLRIMEDETGEKVLVAFGQWSPEITKSTSSQLREARIKAARIHAQQNAIAELTNFINSTLVLEEVGQLGEIEDLSRITTGKRVESMPSYEIIEPVEAIINQYGRAKLEGITTIKEWAANDPNTGHVIIGHVAMWSPATRDAALGIVPTPGEEIPAGKIKYDEEVRESPALDHLNPTLRP